MARYNLAARSLRHLRFARRMAAGQPLLARAASGHHASAHVPVIALDGSQLPVGQILRHLPQPILAAADDEALGRRPNEPDRATRPAASALRLLPRLPQENTLPEETDSVYDSTTWQQPGDSAAEPHQPHQPRLIEDTPDARAPADTRTDTSAPATPPVRPDRGRPRSRIVELPGIVSQPPVDATNTGDAVPAPQTDAHVGRGDGDTDVDTSVDTDAEGAAAVVMPETGTPEPTIHEAPAATSATATPRQSSRRGKRTATAATTAATPAAPPQRAADALFPPTDADRSPQTWLARLQGGKPAPADSRTTPETEPPTAPAQPPAEQGNHGGSKTSESALPHALAVPDLSGQEQAAVASTAATATGERPAPLPESSRALLHTLTGVDPVGVRIYRGPVAERLASSQHADALTDGNAVVLGAGHATDTPETLGLIAHEMTHIAQRRAPRFVPPIAQMRTSRPFEHEAYGSTSVSPSQPAASLADQEAQAALVEVRATHIARARFAVPLLHEQQPSAPAQMTQASSRPTREQPQPSDARPIWGNLPAPWEPLPEWLGNPTNPAHPTDPAYSTHPASTPASPAPVRTPSAAPSADGPGTQRAEIGRSMPVAEAPAHPASAESGRAREGGTPEPDLDALAQQVHAILKRRLAAERRRFG